MIVIKCDVAVCRKELNIGDSRKVRLLLREYDLCISCYDSLVKFVNESMVGGIIPFEEAFFGEYGKVAKQDPALTLTFPMPAGTVTMADGNLMLADTANLYPAVKEVK